MNSAIKKPLSMLLSIVLAFGILTGVMPQVAYAAEPPLVTFTDTDGDGILSTGEVNAQLEAKGIDSSNSWILAGAELDYYLSPQAQAVSFDAKFDSSIEKIGDNAFSFKPLRSITIPNSIKEIGKSSFLACGMLVEITIPDSVTAIGSMAFMFCANLTNIYISNNVRTIEMDTFAGCERLNTLHLPNQLEEIKNGALGAFAKCQKLTSITFPESLKRIGEYAFQECTGLTELNLDSEISISFGAFSKCLITTINFGANYTAAFDSGLRSLKYAHYFVSPDNPVYSSEGGVLYNKDKTQLLRYPPSKTEDSFTVPVSVKEIIWQAFANCGNLKNIQFAAPSNLEVIEDVAFGNSGLVDLVLPDGLLSIGTRAFSNLQALESVVIPQSLTHIGASAFFGCPALTKVDMHPLKAPDADPPEGNKIPPYYVFTQDPTTTIKLHVPDGAIGYGAVWQDAQVIYDLSSPPSILTESLPEGKMNAAYTGEVTIAGTNTLDTPVTFSITEGIWPGLLNASTGTLTWAMPEIGVYNFTLTATNNNGRDSKSFSVVIYGSTPRITTTSISNAVVDEPYNFAITATGIPAPTIYLNNTTLPHGLSFENGVISGTPTQRGVFRINVIAENSEIGNATKALTLIVGMLPTFNTLSLPIGTAGETYTSTVSASSNVTGTSDHNVKFKASGLPQGLTMSTAGIITGKPNEGGLFTVRITAENSHSFSSSKDYILTIDQPVSIASVTANGSSSYNSTQLDILFDHAITGLTDANVTITDGTGSVLQGSISGSGNSWSVALDDVYTQGTVSVAVTAPDGYRMSGSPVEVFVYKDGTVTLTALPVKTTLTPGAEVNGQQVAWFQSTNIVGTKTYSVVGTPLPAGLSLNSATGEISVADATQLTETAATTVTIKLIGSTSGMATAQLTITISAAAPAATLNGTATISNAAPKVGDVLTASLDGGNNTGTLTYEWKSGGVAVGGNSPTYTVQATDLGKTITVTITSSVQTGSVVSSATTAVAEASGGVTPTITITTHPTVTTTVTVGSITGNLTVSASVTESGAADYQWYSCDNNSYGNSSPISGETGASFTIPTTLTTGTYYYFCAVSATGAVSVRSNVAKVIVEPEPPTPPVTGVPAVTSDNPIELDLNGVTKGYISVSLGTSGSVLAGQAHISVSGSAAVASPADLSADGNVTVTAQSVGTATISITFTGGNVTDTSYDKAIVVNVIDSYTPPAKLITLITVSGTGGKSTITTNGGTLQMLADILPTDADVQTVTWSITSGGTFANLNSTGLLTATGNGSATVQAAANDGSGVTGTATITITGQTVPAKPVPTPTPDPRPSPTPEPTPDPAPTPPTSSSKPKPSSSSQSSSSPSGSSGSSDVSSSNSSSQGNSSSQSNSQKPSTAPTPKELAKNPPKATVGESFSITAPNGSLTWDETMLKGEYDSETGTYTFTPLKAGETTIIYTDENGEETAITVTIADAPTPMARANNSGGLPTMLIIILVIVGLGGAGLVIVIVKRKKQP